MSPRHAAPRPRPRTLTLRTVVGAAITLAILTPQILTAAHEAGVSLPWPWVAATEAAILTGCAVVTRIMAIPMVNAWLARIGLGHETEDHDRPD